MERGKMNIEHNLNTGAISVRIEPMNGTVWMTKYEIARMFDVLVPMVTANLKVIYSTKELSEVWTVKYLTYTQKNGQVCHTELYNLDVIIALAFRMKGGFCHRFREWIREQAKRPIVESCRQPIIIQLGKNTFMS
ncbi:hypothetical protein HCH04_15195 [Bacteroides thetaiotaomicron]|uniref:hypothetical protein n=1 Tax=Bacteroides thetaiotaomicron TaxID=818 RepID=UPI001C8CB2FF|nr:hypothetical protein [Bacteroides thetaiotaomicron]MBX9049656.1 hypothetical protein [Bacteroides thetaiotaomicron]MBX9072918.1 hypothetical protein [Bacteroides thetaiotaomicron]